MSSAIKNYLLTYLALLALLTLTLGLSYLDLGPMNSAVGIGIAGVKALLIAALFMHLKKDRGTIRTFALMGVFWLLVLISLTLSDYLSRNWFLLPGHWPIAH